MSSNNRPSIEEAQAVLSQEQETRVTAAMAELNEFIANWGQRHQCRLDVTMIITQHGNMPQLTVVPEIQ